VHSAKQPRSVTTTSPRDAYLFAECTVRSKKQVANINIEFQDDSKNEPQAEE
jgi:hypothetical protein